MARYAMRPPAGGAPHRRRTATGNWDEVRLPFPRRFGGLSARGWVVPAWLCCRKAGCNCGAGALVLGSMVLHLRSAPGWIIAGPGPFVGVLDGFPIRVAVLNSRWEFWPVSIANRSTPLIHSRFSISRRPHPQFSMTPARKPQEQRRGETLAFNRHVAH